MKEQQIKEQQIKEQNIDEKEIKKNSKLVEDDKKLNLDNTLDLF